MNELLKVAEGILDNKGCQHECCATPESVLDYAESFDPPIDLIWDEAEMVSIYCKHKLKEIEEL